jgi:thioredoxin-related protein
MRIFAAFLLLSALTFNASANTTEGALTWYTSLDEAHKLSVETGKPIFGFFTGSDWCGWCIKLQKDVFAKEAFITWASENVILLELDFPRKTAQDATLKTQNQNLQQAFQVTGFPTVWIFTTAKDETTGNYSLTAWGKAGYPQGATAGKEEEKFLADISVVMANKPKEN